MWCKCFFPMREFFLTLWLYTSDKLILLCGKFFQLFVLVFFCSRYIYIQSLLMPSASETVDCWVYVHIIFISLKALSYNAYLFPCVLYCNVIFLLFPGWGYSHDLLCCTFFREMWIICLRNDVFNWERVWVLV